MKTTAFLFFYSLLNTNESIYLCVVLSYKCNIIVSFKLIGKTIRLPFVFSISRKSRKGKFGDGSQ